MLIKADPAGACYCCWFITLVWFITELRYPIEYGPNSLGFLVRNHKCLH